MKTYIILENTFRRKLPEQFSSQEEIRMPEEEVELFLRKFTKSGDKVLDIFAGFGTTLFSSEEMGRIPYGIEFDKPKYDYIRKNLSDMYKENIIHGDCQKILDYDFPTMDFLMTSPPFTRKEDIDAPLTAYESRGTYEEYLKGIYGIFRTMRTIIKPDGYLVVEVCNMKNRETQTVTTLAWDIGRQIAKSHHFLGEIIVVWSNDPVRDKDDGAYGYGYDHSYCLIYRNSLSV